MSIKENIKALKLEMLKELLESNKPICEKVSKMGLEAINAGKGPGPWEEYMKLFAEPGNHLDRLMARDGTETDTDMNMARAYLVADGPCTPDTVINFGKGTSDILDQ